MKTIKRSCFGVLATILIAAGMHRLAVRLDPIAPHVRISNYSDRTCDNCSSPCYLVHPTQTQQRC